MSVLREKAAELAQRWEVELGDDLPGATCSLVIAGRHPWRGDVVLKVPDPARCDPRSAASAAAFVGRGGVAIYARDDASGAVLMPRLRPGGHLAEADLPDSDAVDVLCDLLPWLHQAPLYPAVTLADRMAELERAAPRTESMDAATEIAHVLLADSPDPVLLHGDLHHFNLVQSGDAWVAIDPESLCGDPAYDISAFMRNPLGSLPTGDELDQLMRSRLARFSDRLGHPVRRLWGWSFAQTVLATIWSQQDDETCEDWERVVGSLGRLREEFWT